MDPEGGFAVNPWTISAGISFVSWAYHEVASSRVTGDAIQPTTSPIDFFAGAVGARLGSVAYNKAGEYQFSSYQNLAEKLDVSSSGKAAIFYSGGPSARGAAESYVNGSSLTRTTLEMTQGGKFLESKGLFNSGLITKTQASTIWDRVSERFAEQASGSVRVFMTEKGLENSQSIFQRTELPALLKNSNVDGIIGSIVK